MSLVMRPVPAINQVGCSTVSLTDEGWEASDYIDPGDDWALQADGSYLSPDGTLRSWPAAGPEPI